jgi:hypothetical protein
MRPIAERLERLPALGLSIREASFGCMDDVEILGDTLKDIITAGWRSASKALGWPTSGKPSLATWMTSSRTS